ncbi:MAG TPA: hypothetical protein VEJ89_00735 [Myxococcaceae bacterium]|jgi:uncharacterized membrane protein YeaQ/YmgE (transglycosylase-associated protein family)|nr:hypothetical protein [Myxococcaceae bacterium]
MSFFLYAVIGAVAGILWNVVLGRRTGIGVMTDLVIGLVGALGGGALTAFPDVLARLWVVDPLGIALGIGGAGGALVTAALIASVPSSMSGNF